MPSGIYLCSDKNSVFAVTITKDLYLSSSAPSVFFSLVSSASLSLSFTLLISTIGSLQRHTPNLSQSRSVLKAPTAKNWPLGAQETDIMG